MTKNSLKEIKDLRKSVKEYLATNEVPIGYAMTNIEGGKELSRTENPTAFAQFSLNSNKPSLALITFQGKPLAYDLPTLDLVIRQQEAMCFGAEH